MHQHWLSCYHPSQLNRSQSDRIRDIRLVKFPLLLITSSFICGLYLNSTPRRHIIQPASVHFAGSSIKMGPIKSLSQKSSSGAPRQRATSPINDRKRTKKEKPMKAIFKGLTMSICGNHFKFDKSLTYESIAQYITDDTTHLICSIEEYKEKGIQGNLLPRILHCVNLPEI
jgi:hypothetical protein